MRAIAIDEYNTEPTFHDLPDPVAGDGEVVVDVEWASINNVDVITVAGGLADMMPYEFPITVGRDFSGTIAALGEGVTDLAIGDPVYGMVMSFPLHEGTFAEQAKVNASSVVKRPAGLDAKDAGSLGVAGFATKAQIDWLALEEGETVLVTGASGGMGSFGIQMAKARGAAVIAAVRSSKADFVRELGADEVVDFTGDLASEVRTRFPDGVDCVVHNAGNPQMLADLLVPGGRFASSIGAGQDAFPGRNLQAVAVRTIPSPTELDELADMVVRGDVRVAITRTYGLADAARGLEEFKSGSLGKFAVQVREQS